MKTHLKSYRLFLLVVCANLFFVFLNLPVARMSAIKSASFLLEVLLILPPVMVLMGLLEVWLPRRLVEKHLGTDAGLLGAAVAIFLGTAAAGPLYAAFPVAVSLQKKGARLANIVIFLGAWAAIKIPMVMMESSFISLRFALLRLAFTIPCIMATGYLMERMVPVESLPEQEPLTAKA
jgi:uncharacterized membrane protein YraQ (UPF0718 family)